MTGVQTCALPISLVPPPRPLAELRAAARARLEEATLDREAEGPVLPASFAAPCDRCGRPRLSAVESLCVDCSCEVGS